MKDLMDNTAKRGDMRFYKGQAYHCTGFNIHARKDGTELWLIQWETPCLTCQKVFNFSTPLHVDKVYPNRRCKDHATTAPRRKWRKRTK